MVETFLVPNLRNKIFPDKPFLQNYSTERTISKKPFPEKSNDKIFIEIKKFNCATVFHNSEGKPECC